MTTTYEVEAHYDGRWWAISAPALPAVHTQAARLADVEAMATEAIALHLDLDESTVRVAVCPIVDAAPSALAELARARAGAEKATVEAHRAAITAARDLRQAGLSMREAGRLMGVSHQRVHQLLQDA